MEQANEQELPTTGATGEEQKDLLGGTTNLTLDQLKKEGGIARFSEGNPNRLADEDDLNEIKAGDDLDEPDPDAGDLEMTGTNEAYPDDADDESSGQTENPETNI